jgi:nucleoside-diphosphate-sugar epimerase
MNDGTNSTRAALVTGASGFVGSHLVRRLIREGWEVSVLARDPARVAEVLPQLPSSTIHHYGGSAESIQGALEAARPDVVFHLASHFVAEHGQQDIEPLIDANIRLGLHLLEAMTRAGVRRLINTGTAWQHYLDEPYNPVCLYAATKQAFEDILAYYVSAGPISAVTLKLFDTYGPEDRRKKLIPVLLKAIRTGEVLQMSPGEQQLDLVFVDDVLEAYLRSAAWLSEDASAPTGGFAVSSGETVSLRELVDVFSSVAGAPLNVVWGARPYRKREVMLPWGSGKRLPGWTPKVALRDGIARTLRSAQATT